MKRLFAAVALACCLFAAPAFAQKPEYIPVRIIGGGANDTKVESLAFTSVRAAIQASPEFIEVSGCPEACFGMYITVLEVKNGNEALMGVTVSAVFVLFTNDPYPLFFDNFLMTRSISSVTEVGSVVLDMFRASLRKVIAENPTGQAPPALGKVWKG